MEDDFLIKQVLAGHRGAFKFLVIRYERPVFRFLGTFGLPLQGVEELAQETFTRAFKNLGTFDPAKGAAFSSWLLVIAKNLALNELAKSRTRLESALEKDHDQIPSQALGPEDAIEDATSGARRASELQQAMQKLSPEFRSAISLSYLQELSLDEVAQIENCSTGTVKSRIFRAKALLRKLLSETREKPA